MATTQLKLTTTPAAIANGAKAVLIEALTDDVYWQDGAAATGKHTLSRGEQIQLPANMAVHVSGMTGAVIAYTIYP